MRNVRNLSRLLLRFSSGPHKSTTASDWRTFKKGLDAIVSIVRRVEVRRDDLPLFQRLDDLNPALGLQTLAKRIDGTLDLGEGPHSGDFGDIDFGDVGIHAGVEEQFEEGDLPPPSPSPSPMVHGRRAPAPKLHKSGRVGGGGAVHVRSHVQENLDHHRAILADLDEELKRWSAKERSTMRMAIAAAAAAAAGPGEQQEARGLREETLRSIQIVYQPQLGFLVELPILDQVDHALVHAPGVVSELGLTFRFHTETNLYYKSSTTTLLDENIGDVQSVIVDMERMIVLAVQEEVVEQADVLTELTTRMEELDWSAGTEGRTRARVR